MTARIKEPTLLQTTLILTVLVKMAAVAVSGAEFRLSFLDAAPVLADTCQLLKETGFSEESVATFKKLVEQHNKWGTRVNRKRFPAPHEGYYEFRDLSDLTNRLQTLLHWTPLWPVLDQRSFTCFDAACMLLRGAGCESPDFEKDLKARCVVLWKEGPETFRSQYKSVLIPERDYRYLVGRPRSEAETQLVLSVRAWRTITATNLMNEMAWREAFGTFVGGMKDGGFVYPQKFKLGLGFFVLLNSGESRVYLSASHAFICIPKGNRLICLEKNGSPGPYVRAEFECEEDLARYISWPMLEDAKHPKLGVRGCPVLVSLNERVLGVYLPDIKL